jgi:hypothetical protein
MNNEQAQVQLEQRLFLGAALMASNTVTDINRATELAFGARVVEDTSWGESPAACVPAQALVVEISKSVWIFCCLAGQDEETLVRHEGFWLLKSVTSPIGDGEDGENGPDLALETETYYWDNPLTGWISETYLSPEVQSLPSKFDIIKQQILDKGFLETPISRMELFYHDENPNEINVVLLENEYGIFLFDDAGESIPADDDQRLSEILKNL